MSPSPANGDGTSNLADCVTMEQQLKGYVLPSQWIAGFESEFVRMFGV